MAGQLAGGDHQPSYHLQPLEKEERGGEGLELEGPGERRRSSFLLLTFIFLILSGKKKKEKMRKKWRKSLSGGFHNTSHTGEGKGGKGG